MDNCQSATKATKSD